MRGKCRAVVISCMDYRFHAPLYEFLKREGLCGQYDLVSTPGACMNHTSKELVDIVERAVGLHDIEDRVYLCHHEDCGAYGLDAPLAEQVSCQARDMKEFARKVRAKFPHLTVHLCFFTLDDEEPIRLDFPEEE